jgi:hypothetical protein
MQMQYNYLFKFSGGQGDEDTTEMRCPASNYSVLNIKLHCG